MATGAELVALAKTRIGEKYVNIRVPKDNANWHGPWDCAEFVSWLVFQKTKRLYGCIDNESNPAVAEAYSGSWVRDARSGVLTSSSEDDAVNTPGVILIRRPPAPGKMGHVAVSDGLGKTVEAAGTGLGVRPGKVRGRLWDFVVKVPELQYASTGHVAAEVTLPFMLILEDPNTASPLVRKVQRALKNAGFDPGKIDGEYGPHTVAAVEAFQMSSKLVSDGVVGPATAKKLGVDWPNPPG
ncbi:peptidoglycan-binding domain-containing protein [Pseudorhodoferax soli]|uniref:Putative peptidoglycan binding protein n=1 Tax=Pseudorhodoferax soli TaxID=545864 RepID=A0A368XWF7_9BURK|nr:peptidoglycan-binding domain-containing protein [Pseudorhodoferax soli]RCW72410.1 putative peptidoglycan binding protein [Pseudorhodoferax soli]